MGVGGSVYYLNAFFMLVGCLVCGTVFLGELMGFGDRGRFGKIGGVYQMKSWYVPIFLLRLTFFSLILQIGTILSFDYDLINYSAAGLMALTLLVFVLLHPYKNSKLSNLAVFINEATILYSFFLAMKDQFINVDADNEVMFLFGLLGMIGINILLALVRTGRYYYQLAIMPVGEIDRNRLKKIKKIYAIEASQKKDI